MKQGEGGRCMPDGSQRRGERSDTEFICVLPWCWHGSVLSKELSASKEPSVVQEPQPMGRPRTHAPRLSTLKCRAPDNQVSRGHLSGRAS
jgi:hypothetical protein